ncbi:PadR family transcriptional regulator [candidate division KSB1 bacterium]
MNLITRPEEMILIAVWKLREEAYSITIRQEVSEISGEDWSLGSIYMPLDRLVRKGMVESSLSDSTPERGGRHKRMYKLTDNGKQALLRVKTVQKAMWKKVPDISLKTSS